MSLLIGNKPVIGISCGDINGIGLEIIIKTISDIRLLEICTPVLFASNKAVNFYRKALPEINFNFSSVKDASRINHKQVNLYHCWEDEIAITPGELTDVGGKYAVLSLVTAAQALKDGHIDGLVTAPIHKKKYAIRGIQFYRTYPLSQKSFWCGRCGYVYGGRQYEGGGAYRAYCGEGYCQSHY